MTIARLSCDAVTVDCGLGMAELDCGLLLSSLRIRIEGKPCWCSQFEGFAELHAESQDLSCADGLSTWRDL